MNPIEDDCAHHDFLPGDQSTLYDALPHFDEDLSEDAVEDLPLSSPPEPVDEAHGGSGSSLPATPAERPCTFCPASLPLPPASGPSRGTLVLDLDGTLIASEELNAASSAYLWNPHGGVRDPDYEAMGRRVWLRPGVREFLAAVRPHFEIVLFTAATQNWAAAAIEQLDPSAYLFDVMLHRDHTTSDLMWDYVKDLSRLGRDLARVVIVDDNPLMFMYQPDNALHIGAYEAASAGGPDNVLERVADLLVGKVAVAEDVRLVLGPLARAKSCISSTINAKSAPEAAAELLAASCGPAASVDSLGTTGCGTDSCGEAAVTERDGAGELDSCAVAAANGYLSDAMACDANDSAAVGSSHKGQSDSEDCEDDGGQQDEQEQSGGEELGTVDDDMPQSHYARSTGEAQGDARRNRGLHCAGAEVFGWGCGAEVPEIFDEHGAAACLGSGVEGAPCQQDSWQQHRCAANSDGAAEGGCPAGADAGVEAAEAVAEEHDGNDNDDFDALMEDAIAEYDSDAYDGQYDDGVPYDAECPAGTATALATAVRAACLSADDYGGVRRCTENESCLCGCILRTCAFGFGCAGVCSHDIFGSDGLAVEVRTDAAADLRPCDTRASCTAFAEPALCAEVPPAASQAASAAAITLAADNAAKTAGDAMSPTSEAQHPRQPPAGMVFLADLHPCLGAVSPVACEAGRASESVDLPTASGAMARHGSKRSREVVCDAAAPHSRLRLDRGDDADLTAPHAGSSAP